MQQRYDVIVIGGGQAGLALAFYLRRTGLSYVVLDTESKPGGSWQHYYDSLRIFSPATYSSLPGSIMPGGKDYYPTRDEVVRYLTDYEKKFDLQINRSTDVRKVTKDSGVYTLETSQGAYHCTALICATGSFRNPKIPIIEGLESFGGEKLHVSQYRSPDHYNGKKIAVVGEGNSGAQILAELAHTCEKTYWITSKPPEFLPDSVDGRYLFDAATQLYEAKKKGKDYIPPSLGHIVAVPPVKEARNAGLMSHLPAIELIQDSHVHLQDDTRIEVDTIIFCTGYAPALSYLNDLATIRHGKIHTYGTKSKEISGLWLVGYGSWTGFASATLIGVGRSARATVKEVVAFLTS